MLWCTDIRDLVISGCVFWFWDGILDSPMYAATILSIANWPRDDLQYPSKSLICTLINITINNSKVGEEWMNAKKVLLNVPSQQGLENM
jgi:hypothetical protein